MIGIYTGRNGELNFETDMIELLKQTGWNDHVINHPTEKDLENNLRQIINENNTDRLDSVNTPLTDNEFAQIINQIKTKCDTPVNANILINGQRITIISEIDRKSYSKNSSIDIMLFDRTEIAGGKSRYQIAEQPIFQTGPQYNDRRGDIMLLINGLPLIHIELKASGHDLDEGVTQIKKYMYEGVYHDLFSMIQIIFVMTPEDCIYFAKPNTYQELNPAFFFHWGDINNNPIHDWKDLIKGPNHILSIPEAHKLIGYYTVAQTEKDSTGCISARTSGCLMVARSYQIHAIQQIEKRVESQRWGTHIQHGGYVWGTTGCGKTLTSYKTGQIIIDRNLADKIVFVVDRIQLSEQSYKEYTGFARDGEPVVQSRNTYDLFRLLIDNKSRWIITSIQKLSKINTEKENIDNADIDKINKKRIVFIVDEAHRSQFGEMHQKVERTFENALFIGFTGTPIFSENDKENGQTSENVFGECLSVYSLADGIRDKNVLGFAPEFAPTFKDEDVRNVIACDKAHVNSREDAYKAANPNVYKTYTTYYNKSMIELESLLPSSQYDNDEYRSKVVDDVCKRHSILSHGVMHKDIKFHAIFATSSIREAIEYYKLFNQKDLKVTALFNTNVNDNGTSVMDREPAIIDIIDNYNKMFGTAYTRETDPNFKKFASDVTQRLSHKGCYAHIPDDQMLDIVIVVDMLLTGFDSKYVNALYLDKEVKLDGLIQAISRTNRIFNPEDKPWGIFRYYRKPYTMQQNITQALKLYCEGGDTSNVIAADINENLKAANDIYNEIKALFESNGIADFVSLPKSDSSRQKFKKLFIELRGHINNMKLQGMNFKSDNDEYVQQLSVCGLWIDNRTRLYDILLARYSDLRSKNDNNSAVTGKVGYDLDISLSEMEQEKIDADYLEEHFKKITITLSGNFEDAVKDMAIEEFSKELAVLSEEHQRYALVIINDIRSGVLTVNNETLKELIAEYKADAEMQAVIDFANTYGLDVNLLHSIYHQPGNHDIEISNLLKTCDEDKIKSIYNCSVFVARGKLNTAIKEFIE